jgi:pimeloyl-ACP methyl ester carboxylesterase
MEQPQCSLSRSHYCSRHRERMAAGKTGGRLKRRRAATFFGVPLILLFCGILVIWARPVEVFNSVNELRLLLSGAQTRNTAVNGIRIHYYALGPASGPVVVLVHGLGGRSEDWQDLAPYLTRAGYRVYLPDLPGYGQSEQPQNFSYSVPDEAAVVVGFFDALGLKRVDLGGWSMGGWIVQQVAAKHPERIRKLMLFDCAGLAVKPKWDTRLFTPNSAAELEQLNQLLMPQPPPVPGFIAEDILRYSQAHAWVIQRALASMLDGHDTTDQLLPNLKMPVLIVWGDVDHIIPLSEGQEMHKLIPQSQFDVVSGCGHLAPRQCASRIGPVAAAFLH